MLEVSLQGHRKREFSHSPLNWVAQVIIRCSHSSILGNLKIFLLILERGGQPIGNNVPGDPFTFLCARAHYDLATPLNFLAPKCIYRDVRTVSKLKYISLLKNDFFHSSFTDLNLN